jgi:hypothetical protein
MTGTGFESSLRSVLAPDPHRNPIDFLEANVKRIPYSPKAGAFRVENTPHLREPLEACADPTVLELGIQGCVQSGKSWTIEGLSCMIPVLFPGPTLILQARDKDAVNYVKTRLSLLWQSIPKVRDMLSADGVTKDGTIIFKGNTCWVDGANNYKNLQGKSIRYLLCDEVWQWNPGAIKDALHRVTAYKWQSKAVLVSQGGTEGDDWSTWFGTTDKRIYQFTCPDCGTLQGWDWENIVFPENAKRENGGWNLDKVESGTKYKCKCCPATFNDNVATRVDMNKASRYVVTNPNAPSFRRGYQYGALSMLDLGLSWGQLAVECIEAKRSYEETGNNVLRQEFVQKRLALTWKEEADEVQMTATSGDYKLGEDWGDEGGFITVVDKYNRPRTRPVPGPQLTDEMRRSSSFVRMRFLSVDVQKAGMYWVARSWDGLGNSRLVGCGYLMTWAEIESTRKRLNVDPANTFVDIGNERDKNLAVCATYGFVGTRGDQRNEFSWVIETPMGRKTETRPYDTPKIESAAGKKVKVFHFSNLRLKDTLSLLIRKGRHTRAADVPDDYLAQMQSEKRNVHNGKPIWEPIAEGRANHLFDCEVIGILPALAWRLVGSASSLVEGEEATEKPTE